MPTKQPKEKKTEEDKEKTKVTLKGIDVVTKEQLKEDTPGVRQHEVLEEKMQASGGGRPSLYHKVKLANGTILETR